MSDKYVYIATFFILGVILIFGAIKYKSPNGQMENPDINKLRLFLAGFLAFLLALFVLIYS